MQSCIRDCGTVTFPYCKPDKRLIHQLMGPRPGKQRARRCGINREGLTVKWTRTPQTRTGDDGLMTSEQLSRITALAQRRFETALMMDNPSNQ